MNAGLPILLAVASVSTYWVVIKSAKIRQAFYTIPDTDSASLRYFLFHKSLGLPMLGIVPLLMCLWLLPGYSLTDYGLTFNEEALGLSSLSIVALILTAGPLIARSAINPKNHPHYPQLRAKSWKVSTFLASAFGWTLYLSGYEVLFRGLLLIPLVDEWGLWPGIAVNTVLYSLAHLPKSIEETLASIPLGIVLCVITLATGMLWPAIIAHVLLALTGCFAAFRYHPEMRYARRIRTA